MHDMRKCICFFDEILISILLPEINITFFFFFFFFLGGGGGGGAGGGGRGEVGGRREVLQVRHQLLGSLICLFGGGGVGGRREVLQVRHQLLGSLICFVWLPWQL